MKNQNIFRAIIENIWLRNHEEVIFNSFNDRANTEEFRYIFNAAKNSRKCNRNLLAKILKDAPKYVPNDYSKEKELYEQSIKDGFTRNPNDFKKGDSIVIGCNYGYDGGYIVKEGEHYYNNTASMTDFGEFVEIVPEGNLMEGYILYKTSDVSENYAELGRVRKATKKEIEEQIDLVAERGNN